MSFSSYLQKIVPKNIYEKVTRGLYCNLFFLWFALVSPNPKKFFRRI